jgi:hypothetical protein
MIGTETQFGKAHVNPRQGFHHLAARAAAKVLKKAQELDNTEHSMFPFIEKFRSLKEAVAKFGRI